MKKVKYPEFAKRLKEARISRHLKQKDCLKKLGDITPQMLSDWESGYVFPSYNYLIKISEFYEKSLDYLLLGKQNNEQPVLNSYKDVLISMLLLIDSGLFSLEDVDYRAMIQSNLLKTSITSDNRIIFDFFGKYRKLLNARETMKEDLFETAIRDLLNQFNIVLPQQK